jgi:hypothetical protein
LVTAQNGSKPTALGWCVDIGGEADSIPVIVFHDESPDIPGSGRCHLVVIVIDAASRVGIAAIGNNAGIVP